MLGLITVNQLKIYMSEVMMMIITAKPILSQYAMFGSFCAFVK